MTETPSTIPGWEQYGYSFVSADSSQDRDGGFGYIVHAPDGEQIGQVHEETPEAASAAACLVADGHRTRDR